MQLGLGLGLTRIGGGSSLARLLFSANEPGFTFEPWDITTLYQDRAGTTPVTAAGQSVGLRLSKDQGLRQGPELVTNGSNEAGVAVAPLDTLTNFTTKAQSADRAQSGTYSAKLTANSTSGSHYWNLTNVAAGVTVQISGWVYVPTGATAGQSIKLVDIFDGSFVPVIATTFDQWVYFSAIRPAKASAWALALGQDTAANWAGGSIYVDGLSIKTLAGNHEVAVSDAKRGIYGWMPKTGKRNLLNATDTLSTQSVTVTAVAHTLAFTGTGTVTLSGVSTAGPLVGTGAGNRVTLTFTPTAGSLTLTVSGSVTLAQLELGSTATAYQRVASQYDITESGVPTCYYVQADGVDDAYVTPTITPNTDKAQVFAGVRKLSDAAFQAIVELSADPNANAGSLSLGSSALTGDASRRTWVSVTTGSTNNVGGAAIYAAPISGVLASEHDISQATAALETKIRVNGVQQTLTFSGVSAGTGNFNAYPAYIYSRGGAANPFNGLDFGHAVRFGPNLDAATIARVESLIARNTPEVTL